MPTNVFFTPGVRSEQTMFEDIVIESIKMHGQDVYYLPRSIVMRDRIFGEDVESEFNTAYLIEVYPENIEGFEGEGNIFSKFGMQIRDEATLIVARRSWERLVGNWNNGIHAERPAEGDLIYVPLTKSMFEISFVEHEQPFYQLNNLPIYKLQVALFEHNDEDFTTGVEEVDLMNKHASATAIEIGDYSPDLEYNIRLYQKLNDDVTISGILVTLELDQSPRYAYLVDVETSDGLYHTFIPSSSGDQSTYLLEDPEDTDSRSIEVNRVVDLAEDLSFPNDSGADNAGYEDTADPLIDFSEDNPFGEP